MSEMKNDGKMSGIPCGGLGLGGWVLGILLLFLSMSNCHSLRSLSERLSSVKSDTGGTFHGESGDVAEISAKKARELAQKGETALARDYWRNALEHASRQQLPGLLEEYGAFVKKAAEGGEDMASDIAVVGQMAELAVVQVSPAQLQRAIEFRSRWRDFEENLYSADSWDDEEDGSAEDALPETEGETINEAVLARTEGERIANLLAELEDCVSAYKPGGNGKPTEAEYKILQLTGTIEGAISQIWLLDRSGLDTKQKETIDGFPKRLADGIDRFNAAHDSPILAGIQELVDAPAPESQVFAKHQANISFFTNQYAMATDQARLLRGESAQIEAQKAMGRILEKVADEKRQQVNAYQAFVANCCKLAWDGWDELVKRSGGKLEWGHTYAGKQIQSTSEFLDHYVKDYAREVPVEKLAMAQTGKDVFGKEALFLVAFGCANPEASADLVKEGEKALIVLALYGFCRIDQALLTPETAQAFNDICQKYKGAMSEKQQRKFTRWTIEQQPCKVRLEDF